MEMTRYPIGWPSWVDLQTTDVASAATFYGAVFGWELGPAVDGADNYRTFMLRGHRVAGVAAGPPRSAARWSSYVAVEDAEATMALALARGGTPVLDAIEVGNAGHRAAFLSPDGAPIGVWQAGDVIGAELCNEPGSFCWNELNTRDSEAVIDFYPRLFDWTVKRSKTTGEYYEFQVDGHTVAGMQPMLGEHWRGVASHWTVYFSVENVGAAVALARASGGAEVVPVTPIPGVGRYALMADPQGAIVCLLEIVTPR